MASILIISDKDEPGITHLEDAFKKHKYDVVRVEPTAENLARHYQENFDGAVIFTNPLHVGPLYEKNQNAVFLIRTGEDWRVAQGLSQSTMIQEIFKDAFLWMRHPTKKATSPADPYSRRLDFLKARVQEFPQSAQAHYELGMAHKETQQPVDAFNEFQTALHYDLQHVNALGELLELVHYRPELHKQLDQRWFASKFVSKLFGRSDLDESREAVGELEKIIIQHQTNPEPFVFLGEFKLKAGDLPGAYDAYREAVVRSGSLGVENVLRTTKSNEYTMRDIAFGLQIFSSRIKRLFPKKWSIGKVILKVYDQSEEQRARVESAMIDLGNKYHHALTMPDGSVIAIPTESLVLTSPQHNKVIHRMNRLPGKNAYFDVGRMNGVFRFGLLSKLTTAAAMTDHFYTRTVLPNEPGLKSKIADRRSDFFSRRMQKFFKPLEELLGFTIPKEDGAIIEAATRFADQRFLEDTPEWLCTIRTDHCLHNYLLNYNGNRLTDPPDKFIRECSVGRIDLENDELCYGIWDIINLIEYPGTAVERNEGFGLVLNYMVNRANAISGSKTTAEDLFRNVHQKGEHRYAQFNEYINEFDKNYADRESMLTQGKRASPTAKARFHYVALRFARQLELAGMEMRKEHACNELLEDIRLRKPFQGPEEQRDIVQEYLGTEELTEQQLFDELSKRVDAYKTAIHADRLFRLKRAQESLEELVRRSQASSSEIQDLYVLMNKQKDYFGAAERPIGTKK